MIAIDERELIIAAIFEPARHDGIRHPRTPATLNSHARVNLRDADDDAADGQRKENRTQMNNARGILLLDGIEDCAIPNVDSVL